MRFRADHLTAWNACLTIAENGSVLMALNHASGSVEAPAVSEGFHRTARAQYRQIDIWILLGKIGFECSRRMPRDF
jgi:hypothetical protein